MLLNRGVLALLGSCALLVAVIVISGPMQESSELLLKVDMMAHEPYSPPSNMYLWWGDTTNHRMEGAGEHIRHLFSMGHVEGGEWRDPMFLGNNGVPTFRSQRFRRISESCCSTIVMPPFEWDYPVYNVHKVIGQRVRNYVANGNMLVLTGGIMAIEFINTYFFYNIELADGNYSPGPFHMLPDVPEAMKSCPRVLPQKGIAVTSVKKESLPSGSQVLWGTPRSSAVFMIKFCEAQSPQQGMPPVKILPRDCPASEKLGRPCSCGHIIYIGYNFQDRYPTRYDHVLRATAEILSPAALEKAASKGKGKGGKKAGAVQLSSWQSTESITGGGHHSGEQQLMQQEDKINHLEKTIKRLREEEKDVHEFTREDEDSGKGHAESLAELEGDASNIGSELEGLRGRRREYRSRGGGTQSLAQMEGEVHGVEGLLRRLE